MRKIAREQRAEGEPKTMSRVQGMVEERWPKRPYNVWINRSRRHVSVRVARDWFEASEATWLDAFDTIDVAIAATKT